MSTSFGSALGGWCAICICLQRESELWVTQELALQSRCLRRVRYFWCSVLDLSSNISVVPNPQLPFNTELLTTFALRGPLANSSLHPTCMHLTWRTGDFQLAASRHTLKASHVTALCPFMLALPCLGTKHRYSCFPGGRAGQPHEKTTEAQNPGRSTSASSPRLMRPG